MLDNEKLDHIVHAVSHKTATGLLFLGGRISTLRSGSKYL
jgi:hypothetical protein